MSQTIVITSEAGARIRALRKAKGWRQKDLALKAGIEPPHMCRIEKGGPDMVTRRPTFAAICVALGCEPKDILGADLPGDPDALRAEIRARIEQLEDERLPLLLSWMVAQGFSMAAAA